HRELRARSRSSPHSLPLRSRLSSLLPGAADLSNPAHSSYRGSSLDPQGQRDEPERQQRRLSLDRRCAARGKSRCWLLAVAVVETILALGCSPISLLLFR